jgi:hypothetical protein
VVRAIYSQSLELYSYVSFKPSRRRSVRKPDPILLLDHIVRIVLSQILQVLAKSTTHFHSMLEMRILEGLLSKLRQLPCDSDRVANFSSIHRLLAELVDVVKDVFQVRRRGFIERPHACDKVAPDLLTLDESEIVVVQGELDARFEGFVDYIFGG